MAKEPTVGAHSWCAPTPQRPGLSLITYSTVESSNESAIRSVRESSKDPSRQLPERLLWKLWKRRAARQSEFRTGAGARMRVLYPGRPSTSAGPDFRDALLDVEGVGLVRGDVEIHKRQQDWDAHGHGDDPNYSGVVLHAVVDANAAETPLHSGASAPVVSLSDLLAEIDDPAEDGTGDWSAAQELWDLLAQRGYSRPDSADERCRPAGPGGRRAVPAQGGAIGENRCRAGAGADAVRGVAGRDWATGTTSNRLSGWPRLRPSRPCAGRLIECWRSSVPWRCATGC